MNKVLVIIGSDSDKDKMKGCIDTLEKLKIDYEYRIASAHRTSKHAEKLAEDAAELGFSAIIAGAGMAAALPGALAASTILPVIGVPFNSSSLGGVDALYAIVQMPPGIPVATMGIDGAQNAALLAARILALNNPLLSLRLQDYVKDMRDKVLEKDRLLQESLGQE